jgi:phage tail-like protein
MAEANPPVTPPPEQAAGAQPGALVDPFRAYNFKLLIDGVTEGHFTQCSGLRAKVDVIPYREGGGGTVVRKLAGPINLGQLTLHYGFTSSPELWNWFLASMSGQPQRKNVSVLMLGTDGMTEMLRYNLLEAWPCDWEVAAFDALSNQIALARVVLTFESINRG